MWTKRLKEWPDEILKAHIELTMKKLDQESNPDYKIGLRGLLERLVKERERRGI